MIACWRVRSRGLPALAESCGVADVPIECGCTVERGEAFAGCLEALLDRAARGQPFREADLFVGVGACELLELGLRTCDLALPLLFRRNMLAAVESGGKLGAVEPVEDCFCDERFQGVSDDRDSAAA